MEMQTTQPGISSGSASQVSYAGLWDNLYKVYVHIDGTFGLSAVALEVIDGYLGEGEALEFAESVCVNQVQAYLLRIVKEPARNTYLRTPALPTALSVSAALVLIARGTAFCGYQWIDNDGNCLGQPAMAPDMLKPFFKAFK